MHFINGLERQLKPSSSSAASHLPGSRAGLVNLRLLLTTYLRSASPQRASSPEPRGTRRTFGKRRVPANGPSRRHGRQEEGLFCRRVGRGHASFLLLRASCGRPSARPRLRRLGQQWSPPLMPTKRPKSDPSLRSIRPCTRRSCVRPSRSNTPATGATFSLHSRLPAIPNPVASIRQKQVATGPPPPPPPATHRDLRFYGSCGNGEIRSQADLPPSRR